MKLVIRSSILIVLCSMLAWILEPRYSDSEIVAALKGLCVLGFALALLAYFVMENEARHAVLQDALTSDQNLGTRITTLVHSVNVLASRVVELETHLEKHNTSSMAHRGLIDFVFNYSSGIQRNIDSLEKVSLEREAESMERDDMNLQALTTVINHHLKELHSKKEKKNVHKA